MAQHNLRIHYLSVVFRYTMRAFLRKEPIDCRFIWTDTLKEYYNICGLSNTSAEYMSREVSQRESLKFVKKVCVKGSPLNTSKEYISKEVSQRESLKYVKKVCVKGSLSNTSEEYMSKEVSQRESLKYVKKVYVKGSPLNTSKEYISKEVSQRESLKYVKGGYDEGSLSKDVSQIRQRGTSIYGLSSKKYMSKEVSPRRSLKYVKGVYVKGSPLNTSKEDAWSFKHVKGGEQIRQRRRTNTSMETNNTMRKETVSLKTRQRSFRTNCVVRGVDTRVYGTFKSMKRLVWDL